MLVSIAPAPIPKGNANSNSHQSEDDIEKPNKALLLNSRLVKITLRVSNISKSKPLAKLEITVHIVIDRVIIPAASSGRESDLRIDGHATPKIVSGSPKPMKMM